MAVNRTIYTQGAVKLQGSSGNFPNSFTGVGFHLSGIQSANFTVNSPKLDVNAFGTLGPINKVQVEPQAATMEISLIINSGNTGVSAGAGWLSGLVVDTSRPTPSGCVVTASGVGQLSGAIMTAFRMEVAVGALPTLSLTFEGISGANVMTGIAPATTLASVTVPVATPDAFGTLYWNAAGDTTGCPQSVRAAWEMPVERLNCLGSPIDQPTIFSRPPGTLSFTAEGIDYKMMDNYITGLIVGPYKLAGFNVRETSRSVNMAIGESAATFNTTSEGVALGSIISG